jgi:hypothetical protein
VCQKIRGQVLVAPAIKILDRAAWDRLYPEHRWDYFADKSEDTLPYRDKTIGMALTYPRRFMHEITYLRRGDPFPHQMISERYEAKQLELQQQAKTAESERARQFGEEWRKQRDAEPE